ncbi:DUF618-domain-containing protein [Piedraia hortae CBS 480.64]|uniref:DUF618-domain-containing protein n=1 Tax=Piedraia hortae CBS 480.64 TaxID=1314780 RepID=A0A6A7BYT7_9PEZI|nr:DUF618-domain-containing protein [Piedraia hortae CBS 480.64]
MGYSDDAVRAKLSSLNDQQDSIVSNAQWMMFHRRHAPRTVQLWMERLQEAPVSKRLILIYLANEITQQSRARARPEFNQAFEPIIADAVSLAYKNAPHEIQSRIRRVVEVWRQRNIFEPKILEAIEAKLLEGERKPGKSTGKQLGGSLFGTTAAPEVEAFAKLNGAVTKAEVAANPATELANSEYALVTAGDQSSPAIHAAMLAKAVKDITVAEAALESCVTARKALIAELKSQLEVQSSRLEAEETCSTSLLAKKEEVEVMRKKVEASLMNAMAESTPQEEPTCFTPPPPEVESLTPPREVDKESVESKVEKRAETADPRVTCDPRLKRRKTSHQDNDNDVTGGS